jgi:DNA-binding transcriptional MocR family regulator
MTSVPLYQQLAEQLRRAIESGALARGEKLPSVRELAGSHARSTSTVLQALRSLEDGGWIEARPRSGFFVAQRRVAALAEPHASQPPALPQVITTAGLARQVNEMSLRPDVVSFGLIAPEAHLFELDRLRKALSRSTLRHRATLGDYRLDSGDALLRKAVARHALSLGCQLAPDRLLITSSCTQAVHLALRALTRAGDTVAVESPCSMGFLEALDLLGLKALEIPTHPRHGISLDALQLALDTQPVKALLVVPTLSNPIGACMPPTERQRLARMATAHGLPVIEDVIYNGLAEQDDKRRAVSAFDPSGQVLMCGSFSKTVSPGLRLGWISPGRWHERVLREAQGSGCTQVAVVERALADLLDQPGTQAALRRLRSRMGERMVNARALIAQHFPPGTRVSDPPGGFMLWVELPVGNDALQLYQRALAEGICLVPGSVFSASGRFAHCLRIGLGQWSAAHVRALQRLGELARLQQPARLRRVA